MMGCARLDDDSIKTRQGTSLQPIASPELSAIDSLMWQRPDSALTLLLPCFDTCCAAEYDRHYAYLLLAELLYKNDSAQTNRAELRQAVAYYDSLLRVADTRGVSLHRPVRRDASNASVADAPTIAFLDARAHYINGVGYYERDSIVEACKEYILALEIMENQFEEKDFVGEKARFMALTYTHLAGLFSVQYLHEQAIYFGKKALGYYQKYEATPWHMAWMYNEIGSNYHILCDFNKADSLYDLAINVLPDTNNLIYRDIVVLKAFLQYKKVKQAKMSLQQLKSLLLLSESEKEYLARCAIIGEIYFRERQFDSALVYLNQVFQESQNEELKKQTAEFLVDILKKQGQDLEIFEYAEFLVPFANLSENQSHLKSQITTLFQIYEQERQETLHQNKLKNALRKGGLVILGLVTAFFIGFTIYVVISKRRIIAERKTHQMQQAALSGRLKRSNQELRELKEIIQQHEGDQPKTKMQAASFTEEPIYRLIMERVNEGQFKSKIDYIHYKDYALDKRQLSDLRMAVDRHFGQLTTRLKTAYSSLTNSDLDYCCLYLLGLKEADIAALMQKAYSTVCDRSRKIKGFLGTEGELFPALRSLI